MALGRVYCFGPTFRAEKSKTRRHLTEFWMVEPEMAYADLNDIMDLAEDLVVSVVGRVLDKRRRELTVLERDVSKLESVQKPFPRVSYDDAVRTLQSKGLPIERRLEARVGAEAVSARLLRRCGQNAPVQGPADRMGRRLRRTR
jgi:asparaginyl-tRNA synthetase